MKYFCLPDMKPNGNQLHRLLGDKIREETKQGIGYKAVSGLFEQAVKLYKGLKEVTNERLSQFVDSKTYLTERQERDLVALTAYYVLNLDSAQAYTFVEQDTVATDEEKVLLKAAIELFKSSAEATYAALGNPIWVESQPTTQAEIDA